MPGPLSHAVAFAVLLSVRPPAAPPVELPILPSPPARTTASADEPARAARHPLWPRPVVTAGAVDRTLELHRPPADFRDALERRFAAYEAALVPIVADAEANHGHQDRAAAQQLHARLFRPPNREFVMFPGLESDTADPGGTAPPEDPRWAQLETIHRRIAGRRYRLWSRLRTLNVALLADVALLAQEHEVRWSDELLARLLIESMHDGPWSVPDLQRPAPVDVLRLLPPLLGAPDPGPDSVWRSLDEAVGTAAALEDLRATAWEAVLAHDMALQDRAWQVVMRLPSRTGWSGLGGLPSDEESRRSGDGQARRWDARVAAVRQATETLVRSLHATDPPLAAVVGEMLRLRHLAVLAGTAESRPWVVRIRDWMREHVPASPWNPDELDPRVVELGGLSDRHARDLLDRFVARELTRFGPDLPTPAERRATEDDIRRRVASYEAEAGARLEGLATSLPEASRTAFLEAMTATLVAQRPTRVPLEPRRP